MLVFHQAARDEDLDLAMAARASSSTELMSVRAVERVLAVEPAVKRERDVRCVDRVRPVLRPSPLSRVLSLSLVCERYPLSSISSSFNCELKPWSSLIAPLSCEDVEVFMELRAVGATAPFAVFLEWGVRSDASLEGLLPPLIQSGLSSFCVARCFSSPGCLTKLHK